MVHHDARLRECPCEIYQPGQLGVVHPCLEARAGRAARHAKPSRKAGSAKSPGGGGGTVPRDARIGISRRALANTAKAPSPRLGVSGENAMDLRAQTEVRKAHDSGRDLRGDTQRGRGALRLMHRELGLADRPHPLGPVGTGTGNRTQ